MRQRFSSLRHPRLRILYETYLDYQKLRVSVENRLRAYERFNLLEPEQAWKLRELCGELRRGEAEIAKLMAEELRGHPAWEGWLSSVKGVGPVMAAGLIALVDDISKAKTISSLWRYAGLAPGQGRGRGRAVDYNPKLKGHVWRLAMQLLKARGRFERLYRRFREEEERKEFESPMGARALHVHLRALRRMIKVFLGCFWLAWRRAEGLPVSKPYAVERLGHPTLYAPEEFMEK